MHAGSERGRRRLDVQPCLFDQEPGGIGQDGGTAAGGRIEGLRPAAGQLQHADHAGACPERSAQESAHRRFILRGTLPIGSAADRAGIQQDVVAHQRAIFGRHPADQALPRLQPMAEGLRRKAVGRLQDQVALVVQKIDGGAVRVQRAYRDVEQASQRRVKVTAWDVAGPRARVGHARMIAWR